jgi:hypothetical protein
VVHEVVRVHPADLFKQVDQADGRHELGDAGDVHAPIGVPAQGGRVAHVRVARPVPLQETDGLALVTDLQRVTVDVGGDGVVKILEEGAHVELVGIGRGRRETGAG